MTTSSSLAGALKYGASLASAGVSSALVSLSSVSLVQISSSKQNVCASPATLSASMKPPPLVVMSQNTSSSSLTSSSGVRSTMYTPSPTLPPLFNTCAQLLPVTSMLTSTSSADSS